MINVTRFRYLWNGTYLIDKRDCFDFLAYSLNMNACFRGIPYADGGGPAGVDTYISCPVVIPALRALKSGEDITIGH